MKRILFFILLIPFIARSQDDSTKYINYRFEYGKRSARLQADSVFNTPLRDTTFHPSRAGSLTTRPQDGKTYQWNGTKWNEYGVGGSGSGTVNNGTQYRIAIYPNNGAAVSENTAITGNRVIVSNSNGLPIASSYTSADLDSLFVSDTISNIGTTGDTILKQVNYHKLGFKPFKSTDFDSPGDSIITLDAALKTAWNNKVDSVKLRNDSLFFYVGGVEYAKGKTSVPTIQQVLTAGNVATTPLFMNNSTGFFVYKNSFTEAQLGTVTDGTNYGGQLSLWEIGTFLAKRINIKTVPDVTTDRTQLLPDKDGTFAMTSDITDSIAGKLNSSDTTNKWVNNFYKRGDSVFFKKGGVEYFAFIDGGAASDTANLIVQALGSTGVPVLSPRNDTLYGRKIVAGFGVIIDTLATGEIFAKLDSGSSAVHDLIALYGNDGGGTSTPVIDSIQEVAQDTSMTGNIAINTTLKRLTYKFGGYFYHVPITDSTAAPVALDTDAQTYITAVEAAGVTVTDPQKTAINDFVSGAKTDGNWTSQKGIYFPVWNNANADKINLRNPGTNDLFWAGTWTRSTSGVTPGGTTSDYATTGIIPSTALTQNATTLSVYTQTSTQVNTYESLIGSSDASYYLQYMLNSTTVYPNINAGQGSEGTLALYAGFDIVTRTGATSETIYRNGTSVMSVTTASTGLPTTGIGISLTRNGFGGGDYPSTRKWSFAAITNAGMDATHAANFNTRVEALHDAFGIGQQ